MIVLRSLRVVLLASSALASGVAAQSTSQTASPPTTPANVAATVAAASTTKRVYAAADFARFVPKTAYDMLVQVPSFTIKSPSPQELERGLGQAYENVLINGQRITNKTGGAVDELQRTPASNVDRIEIVDAASLGIAGLAGQGGNVILQAKKTTKDQSEWRPDLRAQLEMAVPAQCHQSHRQALLHLEVRRPQQFRLCERVRGAAAGMDSVHAAKFLK